MTIAPLTPSANALMKLKSWMCQNFLQLNKEKTEVIAFGNNDEFLKVNAYLNSRSQTAKNLPKKTIKQLQLIQHAPARILTRTRKSEHITPVLRSLHWLPVTFRIDFKVLLLIYKSLNGLGPKFIADILTEYKPNRLHRSVALSQLKISFQKRSDVLKH